MLNAFLNKGGAGISISRHESLRRVNPFIAEQIALVRRYDALLGRTARPERLTGLAPLLRTARTDFAKLSEVVLSLGGVPEHVVSTGELPVDADPDERLEMRRLLDQERAFGDRLDGEFDGVEHQIHTSAVLNVVRENSRERTRFLEDLVGEGR